MSDAKSKVEGLIRDNPVMVFSKSSCRNCDRTKELLAKKQAQIDFKYNVIELDQMGEEGAAIQDFLEKRDNQRTVPNIYIMQKHMPGGNSNIQAMGPKLDKALQEAAEASASDSPTS